MVGGAFQKRDGRLLADVPRARTLVENSRDHLVGAASAAAAAVPAQAAAADAPSEVPAE